MTTIPFHKMVASGNDFVVVDNRKKIVRNPLPFTRRICAPHTGIGADGVLLLEPSKKTSFTMRIINSDGSEAEACGNGFRCVALYAHEHLNLPQKFNFESLAGQIRAEVKNAGHIRVQMVKPSGYRNRAAIEVLGHRLHYAFLNTGVPHVVILAQGLSGIDVNSLGRAIRYHPVFQPKGTNVNFVEIKGPHEIEVRTYERGVEAETLACGTGSTASAIIAALSGHVKPPVRVKTRGGEMLLIHFKLRGKNVTDVTLEGAAKFVFEGKLNLSASSDKKNI